MLTIRNPILPGFNPDPSIVRVESDYFIATSTFEWFPGVCLYHSRDLVHWRLLTHALKSKSLLDLAGVPNSGGVWAPCLSHRDGVFHLAYTIVRSKGGTFKDVHNYLVTAPDIMGPWSEPIYLNSSGFDPSLFHDDDGRKWLLNMVWDHRKGVNPFGGILLQEYDPGARRLTGKPVNIFRGTSLGITEGPHLYRVGGWYHLVTAEGGTGFQHAVTSARSRSLKGSYEVDPENPILTSRGMSVLELQKAGHASLVDTPDGEWYMVHLGSRPITPMKRCVLGRETAIQKCRWTPDGWLRLDAGGNHPRMETPAPARAKAPLQDSAFLPLPFPGKAEMDHFDGPALDVHLNSLRIPADESWCTLAERPGFLRMRGVESLSSLNRQSLLARRIQAFHVEAETCLEFQPESFQQMAGLIFFYDSENFVYLRMTHHETLGTCLGLDACDHGDYEPLLHEDIPLETNRIHLKGRMDRDRLLFHYSLDGRNWIPVGPVYDASKLSDDYVDGDAFTGAFVGLCAQDLSGGRKHADYDYFKYSEVVEAVLAPARVKAKGRTQLDKIRG